METHQSLKANNKRQIDLGFFQDVRIELRPKHKERLTGEGRGVPGGNIAWKGSERGWSGWSPGHWESGVS